MIKNNNYNYTNDELIKKIQKLQDENDKLFIEKELAEKKINNFMLPLISILKNNKINSTTKLLLINDLINYI
tara:strand:- start:351 stop:566 length:216 start_codon:yes stop_codon:yes gene_type:complete